MPVIVKRFTNRSKAFRKRRDRFTGSSKPKPFTLSGKLKSNNNLLAKALSDQKQETQSLFIEKIELTRQIQALTAACNKRDFVLSNIQKNAKEMLSMLVTMTNYVTNTIVSCQDFSYTSDTNILKPRSTSATRRESSKRLSSKSPTKGVVKPMVSGHTITKPTINLRRVNMQRLNNVLDLSDIVESSPDRINSTINTSPVPTAAAFTSANGLGYQGERRRRFPERIPVDYSELDDDEQETFTRNETRLSSGRYSEKLSNKVLRKRSGKWLTSHIQSPSVSLCDVSKLLQNSQTINVRVFEDSQGNGDSSRLSTTSGNISQQTDDKNDTPSPDLSVQKTKEVSKTVDKTLRSAAISTKIGTKKNIKTLNKTDSNLETDPLEGPSWLLNSSSEHPLCEESEEEKTVEIFRRKCIPTKLVSSSESEDDAENSTGDISMEFTECIGNALCRQRGTLESEKVDKRTHFDTNMLNHIGENVINHDNSPNEENSADHSDDPDEQCTNFHNSRSGAFVTDRRRQYDSVDNDDDDDDTIMIKLSRGAKTAKFDINDLRLPIECPITVPAEPNDSEPEITTTIQMISQNCMPPSLPDDNVQDRISNFCSLQLPRTEDELLKTVKSKGSYKRKQLMKTRKFYESDCSDSESEEICKKKVTKSANKTNVRDPSSAKVVLHKLDDTQIKMKSASPDQSFVDETQDSDASSDKTFEAGISVTDSNGSIHSVDERNRPRRHKAPTNLKEPNLIKKLRR